MVSLKKLFCTSLIVLSSVGLYAQKYNGGSNGIGSSPVAKSNTSKSTEISTYDVKAAYIFSVGSINIYERDRIDSIQVVFNPPGSDKTIYKLFMPDDSTYIEKHYFQDTLRSELFYTKQYELSEDVAWKLDSVNSEKKHKLALVDTILYAPNPIEVYSYLKKDISFPNLSLFFLGEVYSGKEVDKYSKWGRKIKEYDFGDVVEQEGDELILNGNIFVSSKPINGIYKPYKFETEFRLPKYGDYSVPVKGSLDN